MKCLLLPLIVVLAGCSPSPDSTDTTSATAGPASTPKDAGPSPAMPEVAAPATPTDARPPTPPPSEAVAAALRIVFNSDAGDVRYFHQVIDLDGDGRDEIVAHVVGPNVCGSGGCDTVVLAPDGDGYRVVADIASTRPPISAAMTRSNGWRDLVVTTGRGGGESGPVLLHYDGTTYPSNPAVAPAKRLSAAPDDEELLIKTFGSFTEGAPLDTRQ